MRYRLATYRECKAHREWNTTCPDCGRKGKFSPYIDTVTMQPVDDKRCGRCSRLSNCGYHLPPKEWFKDNPPEKREWLPKEQYIELMRQRKKEAREACLLDPLRSVSPCSTSLVPLKVGTVLSDSFITEGQTKENCPSLRGTSGESEASERRGSEKIITYLSHMSTLCTQTRSDKNHLARWLCTQFPEEQVAEVLARYRTGSSRDGRIIYWQIDHSGQVRAGKVMAYDLDGHRMKDGKGNVCWVHSMKIDGIRFDELVVPQCLFGEHLLETHPNPPCEGGDLAPRCQHPLPHREGWGGSPCLVESEKTALIMSLIKPDTVWLATGGKANFKEQMLWPLLGHEVAVYPDADALHDWAVRIAQLNRVLGHRLYIPTGYYNLMDHDEARREGWDLADILLREE